MKMPRRSERKWPQKAMEKSTTMPKVVKYSFHRRPKKPGLQYAVYYVFVHNMKSHSLHTCKKNLCRCVGQSSLNLPSRLASRVAQSPRQMWATLSIDTHGVFITEVILAPQQGCWMPIPHASPPWLCQESQQLGPANWPMESSRLYDPLPSPNSCEHHYPYLAVNQK